MLTERRNTEHLRGIPGLFLVALILFLPSFHPVISWASEGGRVKKIFSLIDKGRTEEALAAIKVFREEYPNSTRLPELWLLRADLTRDYYSRTAALREVAADFPDSPQARKARSELVSLAYLAPDIRNCVVEADKFLGRYSHVAF